MPLEFHVRLGGIHCELDGRIRIERDSGFFMQFLVVNDSQNFQRLFATPVDPNSLLPLFFIIARTSAMKSATAHSTESERTCQPSKYSWAFFRCPPTVAATVTEPS